MPQGIQLLGSRAGKYRQCIRESGEFPEFFLPYAEDGEGGHNEHPPNSASLRERPGDGDSR